MLAVAIFNFPYAPVRAFLVALALTVAIAGALAVAVALTPFLVGCCVALLPVIGKTLAAAVVVAVYAWWFKP